MDESDVRMMMTKNMIIERMLMIMMRRKMIMKIKERTRVRSKGLVRL